MHANPYLDTAHLETYMCATTQVAGDFAYRIYKNFDEHRCLYSKGNR